MAKTSETHRPHVVPASLESSLREIEQRLEMFSDYMAWLNMPLSGEARRSVIAQAEDDISQLRPLQPGLARMLETHLYSTLYSQNPNKPIYHIPVSLN